MSTLPDFYQFSLPLLDGGHFSFKQLKGKHALLVNVASECGFTPQYRQLQEMHTHYADRVSIIGFPCNDFGGQEPGSPEEIRNFCDQRYQISFPLTEKIQIRQLPVHPIYQWLTQQDLNGVADYPINWNFTKFLISPEGQWIEGYGSAVSPFADEILHHLGIHNG